jgi:hypothetical protein
MYQWTDVVEYAVARIEQRENVLVEWSAYKKI